MVEIASADCHFFLGWATQKVAAKHNHVQWQLQYGNSHIKRGII